MTSAGKLPPRCAAAQARIPSRYVVTLVSQSDDAPAPASPAITSLPFGSAFLIPKVAPSRP